MMQVQTETRKEPQKTEWLRCPNCNQRVAKKIGRSRWEAAALVKKGYTDKKRDKSKDLWFRVEVVMGKVPCLRCGRKQDLPP